MRGIITLVTVMMVCLVTVPAAMAADLYTWTDEKGAVHITDQPPQKAGKIIDKYTYEKESAESAQRYEQEKKEKSDLEERQAGAAAAAASREKMKQGEQAEKQKAEALQKAKEKCESMKTNEVLYNNLINNMSLEEGRRNYYRQQLREISAACQEYENLKAQN